MGGVFEKKVDSGLGPEGVGLGPEGSITPFDQEALADSPALAEVPMTAPAEDDFMAVMAQNEQQTLGEQDIYQGDPIQDFEADDFLGDATGFVDAEEGFADENDGLVEDDFGDAGITTRRGRGIIRRNPHFLCLGTSVNGNMSFMNLKSALILEINTAKMNKQFMLRLAGLEFWKSAAPIRDEEGRITGVNWDLATDIMFRETEYAGYWNPRREVRQGARMDGGRVVFHTGQKLWIEGLGIESLESQNERHLEYLYAQSSDYPMPEMENAFPADSEDVRSLKTLIQALDWRPEDRRRAPLSLFGYLMMAPICGILKWRPHIWMDGPRGGGKTWVVQNIVNPTLGKNRDMVKANTTESGLRNALHARAVPVIFDEAEGASQRDKARMDEVISLIRHTSSETEAYVAQGVSGGGASKSYEVNSMFFLASITTRIDLPADRTRFARISLASGLRGEDFVREIELPARDLLTPLFSSRLVARMIQRARHAEFVIDKMTRMFMEHNMERRIADVYGVFAAGAWLALRDDVPESSAEAALFIKDEFGALKDIIEVNKELTSDRDHERVISALMSSSCKIDTGNGQVTESVAVLMRLAAGSQTEDSMVGLTTAIRTLNDIGIRHGNGTTALKASEREVTTFLIHKKSKWIREFLKNTPYETGYADILKQAPGVVMAPTVRFRNLLGDRPIAVPVELFGINDDLADDGDDPHIDGPGDPFEGDMEGFA